MPSGSTLQVRKELLPTKTLNRFTAHFHMLNNIRLNERVLYETSQAFCFQTPTDGITRTPHRQLSLGEEKGLNPPSSNAPYLLRIVHKLVRNTMRFHLHGRACGNRKQLPQQKTSADAKAASQNAPYNMIRENPVGKPRLDRLNGLTLCFICFIETLLTLRTQSCL